MRQFVPIIQIVGTVIGILCLQPPATWAGTHSGIREIYSGPSSFETCALMADHRVKCWGQTPGDASLLKIGEDIVQMALGDAFRCALTQRGTVYCWGHNNAGQLGDGTTTPRDTPSKVQYAGADFTGITSISVGNSHACAINSGAAWCWGGNDVNQIGNFWLPSGSNALTPLPVIVHDSSMNPQLTNVVAMSAGSGHTCALLSDDTGACWGSDSDGQIGNFIRMSSYNSPQTVYVKDGGLITLVLGGGEISAGGFTTCGLVSDSIANSVACWGRNSEGEMGDGDWDGKSTAFPAMDERGKIVDAAHVAVGRYTTCAVFVDTTIRCWGFAGLGELGIAAAGVNQNRGIPLLASRVGDAFFGAINVVAGAQHMCARTYKDEVYCWGDNGFGQIGSSVGSQTDVPTKVAIDSPIFTDDFDND